MPQLFIQHFTDPGCPFAFSAEPIRLRLRWQYGEQLVWRNAMIVLTDGDPIEAERLAEGAPDLQELYGMPIDPDPRSRPASSEPGCRAVIAARLFAPAHEERLLRQLRVLGMAGALLDDPDLIAEAVTRAGLSPETMAGWIVDERVEEALESDMTAARSPLPVASGPLAHRLGGEDGHRRYSAPSYEFAMDGRFVFSLPGFNRFDVYDTAIANIAPELERRPPPDSVEELLEWAGEPLATAEVAMITRLRPAEARTQLARVATAHPLGADCYWTLPGA